MSEQNIDTLLNEFMALYRSNPRNGKSQFDPLFPADISEFSERLMICRRHYDADLPDYRWNFVSLLTPGRICDFTRYTGRQSA